MNINKYQTFLKVVELGSLTRAAEALGCTQSGVSHTVNSPEEELGFTLLIRCSAGTRYASFHQDWAEKMNAMDCKYYQEARRRGLSTREVTPEELHVLTYSVWALYYEPFLLDFTWEQYERHAETIYRFIDWIIRVE